MLKNKAENILWFSVFIYSKINLTQQGPNSIRSLKSGLGPLKYSDSIPASAGFTHRLNRLKPRASTFRGPPTKVYSIFNTVIGLSHLCCHNALYFLNNPLAIFLTQLHPISKYCRIKKKKKKTFIIFAFIQID